MKLAVLPGDGIGPECTDATLTVVEVANRKFDLGLTYEHHDIGLKTLASEGTTLPMRVVDAVRQAEGTLLGPVSHYDYPPVNEGGINQSGYFRVQLDLYANIRPNKTRAGLGRIRAPVDLVIFRECTEGFYSDRNMYKGIGEFMPSDDMVLSVRKISGHACRRIAKAAFEHARTRPRRKVTAVHKANVLKMSDSFFLDQVRKVAADYPDVELDTTIIDATAALLVRTPERFDVIVTTNMYGDILSDLAGELTGSLGLAGSINAGDDLAVGQAQHGSAPDIQGQNIANPSSLILSAGMMLDWMGKRYGNAAYSDAAAAMERALDSILEQPELRTPDIGGKNTTSGFGDAVAKALETA